MTFLPIVIRELRVAARSKATYNMRFRAALASIVYGSYLLLMLYGASFGRGGGRSVFTSLVGLGLFCCALLARNTVDCISEEKREGTLGLLFLTDLKGFDIVLGKLVANSVRSLNALLATVPVVGIAFTLGGITGPEFWRTILALLNVFFFSHAAGLFISTFSRKAQSATGAATALLLFYFVGLAGLVQWLEYAGYGKAGGVITLFNPAYAFHQASDLSMRFGNYWPSLLLVHFNAWLFLAVASWQLPYCWQEKAGARNLGWRDRAQQWTFGPATFRNELRRRLLDINPFLWLVSRDRWGTLWVWLTLGLMGCGWIWLAHVASSPNYTQVFVLAILLNHALLKMWIASATCRSLEEQRRSGALEFLLSCTPLTVPEIIQGQWLALRRRFLGPLIAILLSDVVMNVAVASPRRPWNMGLTSRDTLYFGWAALAAMAMLGADAIAIGWVGMWRAMAEKRPRRASGQTFSRIIFLPWVIFGLLGSFGPIGSDFLFALLMWFVLGIGVDVVFATTAREKLLTQFRALAAVQPEEPLGWAGRLGLLLGTKVRESRQPQS